MTDGNRKLTVTFEMNADTGYCYTRCPHGKDCYAYSMTCQECEHFFGLVDGENIIKCTGARIEKQKS